MYASQPDAIDKTAKDRQNDAMSSLCQEQNSTQVTNRTCRVIFTSYAIIKNGFARWIIFSIILNRKYIFICVLRTILHTK